MRIPGPLGLVPLAVAAALLPAPCAAADETQAVLAAQDARFAATIKGDLAALAGMMTDDLTYTHSSGVTETRAEFLEALRTGRHVYRSIDAPRRRVRLHGDCAIVSGPAHIVIEPGGKRTEVDLLFTELYVREAGSWRMALWQSTRPPAPEPGPVVTPKP